MKKLLLLLTFLLPICSRGQSITIVTSDTSICSGTTVAFVATAWGTFTPHYQWTINSNIVGNDNSMYITDSLDNSDTVRCSLIDAGSTVLAMSDSFVIHVQYIPHAGTITGPDTVCEGTTITLTASVPDGTWTASNAHVSVSNGIVTGKSAGWRFECSADTAQGVIHYIVGNNCGTDTANKTVIIHPKPYAGFYLGMPFDPVYSLCVGAGAAVNGGVGACGAMYATTGNVSVNWWGGVEGTHPGGDYIYCVAQNYCGSDTAGRSITVVAPPDSAHILSTTTSLCLGYIDTLRSGSSKFMAHWYGNGTLSIRNSYYSTTLISANKVGIDTIGLTVSNQCGSKYDKIIVTVNPVPTLSQLQQDICKGYTTMFSSATTGGIWACSQPNIAIANDGLIKGVISGTATISYTMPTGCFTTANIKVADCTELIRLFPDPVKDELIVHTLVTDYFTSFNIVNSIGQQVSSGNISGAYSFVNTNDLTPGVYFFTAQGLSGRDVLRFIKD